MLSSSKVPHRYSYEITLQLRNYFSFLFHFNDQSKFFYAHVTAFTSNLTFMGNV